MRSTIFQKQNGSIDRYVFGFSESIPPIFELIRNFDFPGHNQIITRG